MMCQVAEAKEKLGEDAVSSGWSPELWYTCPKPQSWSGLLFVYDEWHNMPPGFLPPPTGLPAYCRVVYQQVRHVSSDVVWDFLDRDVKEDKI